MTIYEDRYDAEMVALYPRLSTTELAEKFGFTRNAVVRHLRRNGVEVRPRGTPPFSQRLPQGELERTVALRQAGLTYKEIGAELGLHWQSVRERLRRAGVTGSRYDRRLGARGGLGTHSKRGPVQVKIKMNKRRGTLTYTALNGDKEAMEGQLYLLNYHAAKLYYTRMGGDFLVRIDGHVKSHRLWFTDETAEELIVTNGMGAVKKTAGNKRRLLKELRGSRPKREYMDGRGKGGIQD